MITVKNLYNNLLTTYNLYYSKYDLQNPLFCMKGNNVLTWHSYLSKEYFHSYEEYYNWVVSNSQYSMAIGENVLVQLYYEEHKGEIYKASLTFLPSPDSLMCYFRFDMDTVNVANYYHNSYHINFGYNSDDIRFTLTRFPYPSEFIKFILFLCGNSEFTTHSTGHFFLDLSTKGELFTHFFDFIIE